MKRKVYLQRKTAPKRRRTKNKQPSLVPVYDQWMENAAGTCENCDEVIPSDHRFLSQAHIFPKKKFISIRSHPENIWTGCMRCHGQYDSSWEKARKMRIFPKLVERAKAFTHLITETSLFEKTPFYAPNQTSEQDNGLPA